MDRATYLTQSGIRLLDDWGVSVRRMFPGHGGPYLVGSALTSANHRDVDVRLMLDDETVDALAAVINLADLDLCVSLWGSAGHRPAHRLPGAGHRGRQRPVPRPASPARVAADLIPAGCLPGAGQSKER